MEEVYLNQPGYQPVTNPSVRLKHRHHNAYQMPCSEQQLFVNLEAAAFEKHESGILVW